MRYWLLKTEPENFSIDDLAASPHQTTCWDGVRNYQARNFLRDDFRRGDRVLFYHSSTDPAAVMGIAEVVREGYPDSTALDPKHKHFDPDASEENPRWMMVDIRLVEKFERPITLETLRSIPELAGMELLRRGSRLSVQPVKPAEFACIERLARGPATSSSPTPAAQKKGEAKPKKPSARPKPGRR